MRTSSLIVLVGLVLTACRTEGAQVTITNRCGDTIRVGLLSADGRQWQLIDGRFPAKDIPHLEKANYPSIRPGTYTIAAKFGASQASQAVRINEGDNRFRVSVLMQYDGTGGPQTPQLVIERVAASQRPRGEGNNQQGQGGDRVPTNFDETFIPHMGIYYRKVPYSDGTFGAQLTRDPLPGSPASMIRVGPAPQFSRLERGDTIFEMDGQRFVSDADVRNHRYETTLRFVDVRSGRTISARFTLR